MADTKISAMSAAGALTGAELVPLVQDGVNVKSSVIDIHNFRNAYGAWSDQTDQVGSVTAGTPMIFTVADVSDGVTLLDATKFVVPNTGVYNIQFSSQFKNSDNVQHDATIWLRKNGVDVPNTGGQITVPGRKSANILGFAIAAWNYFITLDAADYIEIIWIPESLSLTMEHVPASLSPAYPEIPSVIATIQQVA